MGLARLVSSVALLWIMLAVAATAHELRPSIMDAEVSASEIVLELEAAIEPILAGIDQASVLYTNYAPQAE